MSNERDELAELVAIETAKNVSESITRCATDGETPVFDVDEHIAEAILAAGYRKLEPVWTEGLLNDGEYEYTVTSDCDGSNVKRWRRRPEMVATQKYTAWEPEV